MPLSGLLYLHDIDDWSIRVIQKNVSPCSLSKIGEMNSEYPFLFCSKPDFWMEIADDKVNHLKNKKDKTPTMTFV